jgi:hypothetical protein
MWGFFSCTLWQGIIRPLYLNTVFFRVRLWLIKLSTHNSIFPPAQKNITLYLHCSLHGLYHTANTFHCVITVNPSLFSINRWFLRPFPIIYYEFRMMSRGEQRCIYIANCMCLQTGFGLTTEITDNLQILTTSNYNAIANSHTQQFTTERTKSFHSVLSSPFVIW